MMKGAAMGLVAAALLSGCMAAEIVDPAYSSTPRRPVVIALLDTGLSPYYPIYSVADDSFVGAHVPTVLERIHVDPPRPGQDPRERDAALWESLRPGVLYHFAGTRLLGISVDEDRRYPYVRDADFHGAGTTYVAAREAPEAIIVLVQVSTQTCAVTGRADCVFSPTTAAGMEWAAAQDWIDIISVSIGTHANLAGDPRVHEDVARYLAASEAAARSGKIIVNGAGNDPTPVLRDHFDGPPWVVTVGGFVSDSGGESVMSSKLVDVVANFTEYAPLFGAGEMEDRVGTSFSAPVVAGTLGRALGIVRATDPSRNVTAGELRDALNASARLVGPGSYSPTVPTPTTDPGEIFGLVYRHASAPILLPTQLGWGYVDGGLAEEIARRVLDQDPAAPPEKETIARTQGEWQQAREVYWSA